MPDPTLEQVEELAKWMYGVVYIRSQESLDDAWARTSCVLAAHYTHIAREFLTAPPAVLVDHIKGSLFMRCEECGACGVVKFDHLRAETMRNSAPTE